MIQRSTGSVGSSVSPMVREIDVTKRSIGSVSSSIYPVIGFLIRPRDFFILP